MDRFTLNVFFYCEKGRKRKDGTAPIYASVIVNGDRQRFPIGFFAKPEKWHKDSDARNFCQAVESRLKEIYAEQIRHGNPITPSVLVDIFRDGRKAKVFKLRECYDGFMETSRAGR